MSAESERVYNKAYREKNKAERLAYDRAYLLSHKKQRMDYRLAHKEEKQAYDKKYRRANLRRIKANQASYLKANPEKFTAKYRKRRAMKRGNAHKPYTDNGIFERDGWICGICGMKINKRLKYPHPRSKSIDHILALSKGGADAPINVQAAHLRCNVSKHAGGGGQLRLI